MLGHLGPWGDVGPKLGHLGAHLGPSWGDVGAGGYPPNILCEIYVDFVQEQLDDGWPESVEEQGLLLLVWRHHIAKQYIKDVL